MKFFKSFYIFESVKQAEEFAHGWGFNIGDVSVRNQIKTVVDKLGPQYAKYYPIFIKLVLAGKITLTGMTEYLNFIKKYKINIQQSGVDINSFESEEQFFDFKRDIEDQSAVKRMISMMPKQVKDLMIGAEDKFNTILLNLYKEKSETELKEILFNKISRNKTQEELMSHLRGFLYEEGDEFNVESIVNKIESSGVNATVIYKDDTIVIADIGDFEASVKLGKDTSWCISQREDLFETYVKELNKQFFIWDTSKDREDNMSMIGVTLIPNGYISACHARNDSSVATSYVDKWKHHFTTSMSMDNMKTFRFEWSNIIYVTLGELKDAGFTKKELNTQDSEKQRIKLFPKLKEAFCDAPSEFKGLSFDGIISNSYDVDDFSVISDSGEDDELEYIIDVLFEMNFVAQNIKVAAYFVYECIKDLPEFAEGMIFNIREVNGDSDEEVSEETLPDYVPFD